MHNDLVRICKKLDSFTEKLTGCVKNEEELSEDDKTKIQQLNDEYNASLERFKTLKGLVSDT